MNRKSFITCFLLLAISHSPSRYISQFVILVWALHEFYILVEEKKLREIDNPNKLIVSLFFSILCIIICTLFSSVFNFVSGNNVFWYLFNILPFFVVWILVYQFKYDQIAYGIKWFVVFETVILAIQYIYQAIKCGNINIYAENFGAGDLMAGSLGSFSTPLAVSMCMLTLICLRYALHKRNLSYLYFSFVSFFCALLTGAMSIIFVFFAACLSGFVIFLLIDFNMDSLKKFFYISIVMSVVLIMQPDNVSYAFGLLEKSAEFELPFKAYLLKTTITNMFVTGDISLFGVGGGNYSSRAALIVSGEYLGSQPDFIPATPSYYTSYYITPFFNKYYYETDLFGFDVGSMVSEPFLQYTSILAEGGILAILVLFALILKMLFEAIKFKDPIMLGFVSFFIGVLFTNAWLEYIEFVAVFSLGLVFFLNINDKVKDDLFFEEGIRQADAI
ncbi:MAG: hypothetical protein NT086_07105 [Proteobacteria bacterium]|nr:hypothetical protein [Pseudomonadota bacterium]